MIRALSPRSIRALLRASQKKDQMKKILSTILSLLFVSSIIVAAQNTNSSTTTSSSTTAAKPAKKRGPIFRANKDQIKQAQKILKDRSFYSGEQTGKLDADTRAGLKKYQAAEDLKVTGTLNKVTLVKMGIELTDKQKAM
jgi:peptidoglycan hydrolase-like protein with peptidoglycan-binding domain